MTHEQRLDFEDGKYTLILAENGYTVTALRYGEPWRDFVGDSFISYLAQAVFEKAQAPTDDEREALAEVLHYAQGFDDWGVANETECGWSFDIADAVLAAGFRRPAQTEPTAILFSARQGGKSQAMIDSMLAQANERGIRVEVVYPQAEPTDAQVLAAALEINRAGWTYEGAHEPGCLADGCDECAEACLPVAHSALKAAFTAGQEGQS